MKKILFTSDLLKIDDRRADLFANPQMINVDWLEVLFKESLIRIYPKAEFRKELGMEKGFESLRWKVYNELALPFCSASWAYLYEGNVEFDVLNEILSPIFEDVDLVIGFELPPYLIKFLNFHKIFYVDFTIHPVRFLPDYMFGVRSNIDDVQNKLIKLRIEDSIIKDFARVSKARTERIVQNRAKFIENSAIFFGQIEIDSSLIEGGRLASLDDVERALLDLSFAYPKVFYKAHPHAKNLNELKNLVKNFSHCEWLEMNVYDAMALDEISLVSSLSSGSVIEAKYFGKKTKNYLNVKQCFDYENPNLYEIYNPIYKDTARHEFWEYLFLNKPFQKSIPDPYKNVLKFSLNMIWGR